MQQSLALSTLVRSEIMVELKLKNPLKKPCVFKCEIQGVGLKGDASIAIPPLETGVYKLKYFPIFSAKSFGSITFKNSEIGEFWYQMELEALEAPPIFLSDMSCPIGRSSVRFEPSMLTLNL